MDKKKEIVHVDAELIPKSDSGMKDSDEKAISRRRMLEAGAAALALLMMPKLAFAYTCGGFTFSWPPSGPNLYGDGREAHFEGCANGSIIHNDGSSYISSCSANYYWPTDRMNNQSLGYAYKLKISSIFTTELYDIYQLAVIGNCADINNSASSSRPRLWLPSRTISSELPQSSARPVTRCRA